MSICLRSEMVIERESLVLESAGDCGDELADTIEAEFDRVGLDQTSDWTRKQVRLEPGCPADAREFIVVTHRRFRDLRQLIGCRSVGVHLEVLSMTAIMAPWPKRRLASLLRGGEWWAWSLPRGVAAEEDLRSWLTVVHEVVVQTAKDLARRLGGGRELLTRTDQDALAWW